MLIKMTDDWLEAMDQDLFPGAIFLDLRKAFDIVNHDLYGCSCQTVDSVSTLQEPYLILKY